MKKKRKKGKHLPLRHGSPVKETEETPRQSYKLLITPACRCASKVRRNENQSTANNTDAGEKAVERTRASRTVAE